MITNTGKNILAKYLIGHTTSYASHIAIGCGPKPLDFSQNPQDFIDEFSEKKTLDFEMFRVPIVSRGYVTEDDVPYVVFTAELPTQERYEITEVGIFPAASNPSAAGIDSRILYTFSEQENWEYHARASAIEIPNVLSRLDAPGTNIISISGSPKAFRANSENVTLAYADRKNRQEVPRFLNSSIFVRGDMSDLFINNSGNIVSNELVSEHVHLTGISLNLDKNAPTDLLKIAFSIINVQGDDPLTSETEPVDQPSAVRLLVEFASGETGNVQYANFEVNLIDQEDGIDFSQNRYFVVTKQLQELTKSIGFSWDAVTLIKVYASVLYGSGLDRSPNFWVALDGIRLENVSSVNPVYGLTGYSAIKTDGGLPIVKNPNSSNFIEFRFGFETDTSSVGQS